MFGPLVPEQPSHGSFLKWGDPKKDPPKILIIGSPQKTTPNSGKPLHLFQEYSSIEGYELSGHFTQLRLQSGSGIDIPWPLWTNARAPRACATKGGKVITRPHRGLGFNLMAPAWQKELSCFAKCIAHHAQQQGPRAKLIQLCAPAICKSMLSCETCCTCYRTHLAIPNSKSTTRSSSLPLITTPAPIMTNILSIQNHIHY